MALSLPIAETRTLVFYNSDLDTVCKVHTHKIHACEVHAREVHACEMYVYEVHTYEVHAREMHAYTPMRCTPVLDMRIFEQVLKWGIV